MDEVFLLWTDIAGLFYGLDLGDFIVPSLFVCWVGILLYPLSGIDRRDTNSFLTYVIFMYATNVIFFFVVPQAKFDFFWLSATIIYLLPIVYWRWYQWRRENG